MQMQTNDKCTLEKKGSETNENRIEPQTKKKLYTVTHTHTYKKPQPEELPNSENNS